MLGDQLVAVPTAPFAGGRPAESWLTAKKRTTTLVLAGVVLAAVVGALGADHLQLAVAAVAAVVLVVCVLLRPIIGGLVLAALVPIVSGLAPGVPVPTVRASEALIGLIGVTLIVSARRQDAAPWGTLDWLALAYGVAWAAFGAYNAVALGEHLSLADWGTVLGQFQFFLVYRGIRLSVRTPTERRAVLGAVLFAVVPVAVLAVAQQLHVPGVGGFLTTITGSSEAGGQALGTAPLSITNTHRATGPFANWTSLSGYLFPLLLVLCSLALGRQVGRSRNWFIAIAVLAAAGLLVSEEQSAIIGLLVGVVVLGALHGQLRRLLRWLGIALAVGVLVFGPMIASRIGGELGTNTATGQSALVPQTLGYRGQIWTGQYFPAIEQRPLTGYGVDIPSSVRWQYTESEYVTLLMDGGLPLLLLFAVLTWGMVQRGRAAARSPDPFDQALGRALVVGVLALVVMDIVWPYMSNGGLPQVLWALLALCAPSVVPQDLVVPTAAETVAATPEGAEQIIQPAPVS